MNDRFALFPVRIIYLRISRTYGKGQSRERAGQGKRGMVLLLVNVVVIEDERIQRDREEEGEKKEEEDKQDGDDEEGN